MIITVQDCKISAPVAVLSNNKMHLPLDIYPASSFFVVLNSTNVHVTAYLCHAC